MAKSKSIFVSATDTNVGKTVATYVLATLLRAKGVHVGVMKPVQCAGRDAQFLKEHLSLEDDLNLINPTYAREPLSPHLAFERARKMLDVAKIKQAHAILRERYDVLLIEGAGGLLVPLKRNYSNADLVRDCNAELIIVARLGLGSINHTLLTVSEARRRGINIKGILFSDPVGKVKSLAERSNPREIAKLSGVEVLGTIPYLSKFNEKEVLKKCQHLILNY